MYKKWLFFIFHSLNLAVIPNLLQFLFRLQFDLPLIQQTGNRKTRKPSTFSSAPYYFEKHDWSKHTNSATSNMLLSFFFAYFNFHQYFLPTSLISFTYSQKYTLVFMDFWHFCSPTIRLCHLTYVVKKYILPTWTDSTEHFVASIA